MCNDLRQLFTRRASDLERSDKLLFSLVQFGRYPDEVRKYVLKIWDNGRATSCTKHPLWNRLQKDNEMFHFCDPDYIPGPINDEPVWVHGERYVGEWAQLQCMDKSNMEFWYLREQIVKDEYLIRIITWYYWGDFHPGMVANATKMWFYDTHMAKEW